MVLFMSNRVGTFITFGNVSKPFPRMVEMILAVSDSLPKPVIVQAGPNLEYLENSGFEVFRYCDIVRFNELIDSSKLIISHAGVGALSTSLNFWKKPIIIPREAKYGEHINDHQIHFAEEFSKDGLYFLVQNQKEMLDVVQTKSYIEKPSSNQIGNLKNLAASIKKLIESFVYEKK